MSGRCLALRTFSVLPHFGFSRTLRESGRTFSYTSLLDLNLVLIVVAGGCVHCRIRAKGARFPSLIRQLRGLLPRLRHQARSTRWRSRSKFARPYISRLISFNRFTSPSPCPLLHGSLAASRTAAQSCRRFRAN